MHPHRSRRFIAATILILLLASPSIWIAHQYRKVNLNRSLSAAIKESNATRVEELLATGADPNTRDTPEQSGIDVQRLKDLILSESYLTTTALMDAVSSHSNDRDPSSKDRRIIRALLRNGTDVNGEIPYLFMPF